MGPDHAVAGAGQKHGLEAAHPHLHPSPFVPLWPRMGLDGAAFGSEQPQVIPFFSYFVILLFSLWFLTTLPMNRVLLFGIMPAALMFRLPTHHCC
jgi:hypothetical protein